MKNKGIVIFIVVIIIIIAGFFLFNSFLKKNVIEQTDVTQNKKNTEQQAVLIVPQQAGGSDIFVEKVFLPDGGYVVIHKNDNNKPGKVIGVSEFLKSGTINNFLMNINQKVVEGDTLFAVLHKDDGNGSFDISLDPPILNIDGKPVLVKFNIVSEGSLGERKL